MNSPRFARRTLLKLGAAGLAAVSVPRLAAAKASATPARFAPRPGAWRTFELVTRIEISEPELATRVWLPLPSLDTDWQQSLESGWRGNAAQARVTADARYGARMLAADFVPGTPLPVIELTSRVRTRDRATDWSSPGAPPADPGVLEFWKQPTELIPTDGIVRETALEITRGARGDRERVQRIYDWIVVNTHREPTVRGCGTGDIKAMLETGNLGGKCGDINALFVGLCRAVDVPARDVYGIRLAPSAFGYKQLGSDSERLTGAQHCRAEVHLRGHGWVAMDPADVGKVMRAESAEWIKDPDHPLVVPVRRGLFGGWEGNWLAYNTAHDIALPGSSGERLGFLMYPQAENPQGRYDPLDPDRFHYTISAREIA
ncbi:transglutaminase-like domain-containing protein [Caldimonas tepidiphila]|uniref:transglutaminase-like domain-containing protein n=1 Tax=Caldimonas tepidiphila TaxID=2315841 RepID=UPI000E5C0211|nr:transglutaminase family protein [Caldimonas tepidiphila]